MTNDEAKAAKAALRELLAARQSALRCGRDPDSVTPSYLDALRRHYITTPEADDNN